MPQLPSPAFPLANHDFNSRAEKISQVTIPQSTGNPVLDANLYDLSQRYCGPHLPETILEMLATVLNGAQSDVSRHDLRSLNVAMDEIARADALFAPYEHYRKLTCFGSARTPKSDPNYQAAVRLGELAVQAGFMVITGGGGGIMQAANEGAGPEASFGLNITLPFEQHPNPIVAACGKFQEFYYFFTRKLNLVKQSDALVACPGGFGTMDEIYEAITLMQTGKSSIFPIVLLDAPGEDYWSNWMQFHESTLAADGLISPEDICLYHHFQSAEEAMAHVLQFYSNFHSYYFSKGRIILRLQKGLPSAALDKISAEFSDLLQGSRLVPLTDEADKEPALQPLHRVVAEFHHGAYAKLRLLIDAINAV